MILGELSTSMRGVLQKIILRNSLNEFLTDLKDNIHFMLSFELFKTAQMQIVDTDGI